MRKKREEEKAGKGTHLSLTVLVIHSLPSQHRIEVHLLFTVLRLLVLLLLLLHAVPLLVALLLTRFDLLVLREDTLVTVPCILVSTRVGTVEKEQK
jgi:hypothetical protein